MDFNSRIQCFTAANPGYMTDKGTNQYLLGKEDITVIDVALPSTENIEGILERVAAMGGKRVGQILLTHIHRDHCGGALAFKRRTGARLGISRSRAGFLGYEDFTFSSGDRIAYDGGELVVVHTPGHESGHCCFYEPQTKSLFTGDHILGRGTTVIPPPDGNMAQYLESLRILLPLDLERLLPGHGPVIDSPYAKIKEYIDHRLEREAQVIDRLRSGLETIAAIARSIYTDLPVALHATSERTIEAHLIKLENEGRVRRRESAYFLVS